MNSYKLKIILPKIKKSFFLKKKVSKSFNKSLETPVEFKVNIIKYYLTITN